MGETNGPRWGFQATRMPVWGAWVGVLDTVGWGALLPGALAATGWLAVEVAVHPAETTAITTRTRRASLRCAKRSTLVKVGLLLRGFFVPSRASGYDVAGLAGA